MNPKETILVTGACGYIGSHLLLALARRDCKVIVIDDLSTGFADSIKHGEPLIQISLADKEALARVFAEHRFDTVIHMAASIIMPESLQKPLLYYRNNGANFLNLLECLAKHPVKRFILSSTAGVYAQSSGKRAVTEDHPLSPMTPYGRSKLFDEWVLADFARCHSLPFVTLRYFNVAGADHQLRTGQRSKVSSHIIKIACEAAVGKRDKITIYGDDYPSADGTCIRDYIHVTDLVDAHLAALDYLCDGGASTTLNCGYSRGYSVSEVCSMVERVMQGKLNIEIGERRPGDVPYLVADSSKILKVLPWQPKYDNLQEIIETALAWEQRLASLTD